MKPKYDVIFITGKTGAGKSKLIASVFIEEGVLLLDPLVSSVEKWVCPDSEKIRTIVIDHALNLDMKVLNDVIGWCKWKGVALWIAEQNISELRSLGIQFEGEVFELNLVYKFERVKAGAKADNRESVSYNSGVVLAKQLHSKNCAAQAISPELLDTVLDNTSTRIVFQPDSALKGSI